MNFSSWDPIKTRPRLKASFIQGEVTIEFERTKRIKVLTHVLGNIDFTNVVDINLQRQSTIDAEIDTLSTQGFKYKSISHVFSKKTITSKSEETNKYNIYAHGVPLNNKENCAKSKLKCEQDEGNDLACNPGKCIIGTLERIKDSKWLYESYAGYGDEQETVKYYIPAKESVQLKTILRGRFEGLDITSPASVASTIYLPPKYYLSENFIDTALIRIDSRLENELDKPSTSIIGYEDRKELFIQKIITLASNPPTGGFINQELHGQVTQSVIDTLLDSFSELNEVWFSIIQDVILTNSLTQSSNFSLIATVYNEALDLFDKLIQVIPSSIKKAEYSYNKDTVARPVYSRLPGLAEAYRSDPAFSDQETPAQWLVSGADEFLSAKKEDIANFYANYLDPDTCSPFVLDWLAQHLGLTGELWDIDWERDIKIGMIKNAFGWWDREIYVETPIDGGVENVLTPKGEILELEPFTQSIWTSDREEDNSLSIMLSKIRTIQMNSLGEITGDGGLIKKTYNEEDQRVYLEEIQEIKFFKGLWNGLIEAKGSLLAIVFLCSLFRLKSHSALELEVIEQENGVKTLRPRSGLRSLELDAPTLIPVKYNVAQVGNNSDAKINNYSNQLIAGVTEITSTKDSKNLFFRMPYYYNRNGRSWDKVEYIIKSWLPSNINARVQYPYLSAGLWAAGDAFFKPEIIRPEGPEDINTRD